MLGFIYRLFHRRPPAPTLQDPDFGLIRYWRAPDGSGHWSMEGEWTVAWQAESLSCPDIPGGESGPSPEARAFLLAMRDRPESIWAMAEPAVRELMAGWDAFHGHEPREAFFVSSLSKDDATGPGWEACFDSRPPLKWVNFCLQAEGDAWVTNTICT